MLGDRGFSSSEFATQPTEGLQTPPPPDDLFSQDSDTLELPIPLDASSDPFTSAAESFAPSPQPQDENARPENIIPADSAAGDTSESMTQAFIQGLQNQIAHLQHLLAIEQNSTAISQHYASSITRKYEEQIAQLERLLTEKCAAAKSFKKGAQHQMGILRYQLATAQSEAVKYQQKSETKTLQLAEQKNKIKTLTKERKSLLTRVEELKKSNKNTTLRAKVAELEEKLKAKTQDFQLLSIRNETLTSGRAGQERITRILEERVEQLTKLREQEKTAHLAREAQVFALQAELAQIKTRPARTEEKPASSSSHAQVLQSLPLAEPGKLQTSSSSTDQDVLFIQMRRAPAPSLTGISLAAQLGKHQRAESTGSQAGESPQKIQRTESFRPTR